MTVFPYDIDPTSHEAYPGVHPCEASAKAATAIRIAAACFGYSSRIKRPKKVRQVAVKMERTRSPWPVKIVDGFGMTMRYFPGGVREASRVLDIPRSTIRNAITTGRQCRKGYWWKYANRVENTLTKSDAT